MVTQPVESATDVAPLTRYAAVSREQPTPVLRLAMQQLNTSAGSNQAGVPVTLLGIPAAQLNEIRGWRSNFSSASRAELTRRLAAHTVSAPGPAISQTTTALRVWVRTVAIYPTEVAFWFLLPGQDTRVIRVAVVAPSRWKLVRFPLPRELRGTKLIGIDLNPITQGFGVRGFLGKIWLGPIEQEQAGRWTSTNSLTGWATVSDPFVRNGVQHRPSARRSGSVGVALRPERTSVRPAAASRRGSIPRSSAPPLRSRRSEAE